LSLLLRVGLYAKTTTPSPLPGYPARATRYNPFVPVHIIIAFVNPAHTTPWARSWPLPFLPPAPYTTGGVIMNILNPRPVKNVQDETEDRADGSLFIRVRVYFLGLRSYNVIMIIVLWCTPRRRRANYVRTEPLHSIVRFDNILH